jgi:predicted nucleic acid-binding protein
MIAADTSTWIAFLQGDQGEDTDFLDKALADRQGAMAPVVLTELPSGPKLNSDVRDTLAALPLNEIRDDYWSRAGALRANVPAKRKARLGDALIAQFCVDHEIALVTRDGDFRAFSEAANLNLLVG